RATDRDVLRRQHVADREALNGSERSLLEVFVRHLDGDRAVADGGGHAVDGAVPDVTDGKRAGQAGLPWEWLPAQRPTVWGYPRAACPSRSECSRLGHGGCPAAASP